MSSHKCPVKHKDIITDVAEYLTAAFISNILLQHLMMTLDDRCKMWQYKQQLSCFCQFSACTCNKLDDTNKNRVHRQRYSLLTVHLCGFSPVCLRI